MLFLLFFVLAVCRRFDPPFQLVRCFTVSDLLDKPCDSQVFFPSPPPVLAFIFIVHMVQHSHCYDANCRRHFAPALVFSLLFYGILLPYPPA